MKSINNETVILMKKHPCVLFRTDFCLKYFKIRSWISKLPIIPFQKRMKFPLNKFTPRLKSHYYVRTSLGTFVHRNHFNFATADLKLHNLYFHQLVLNRWKGCCCFLHTEQQHPIQRVSLLRNSRMQVHGQWPFLVVKHSV